MLKQKQHFSPTIIDKPGRKLLLVGRGGGLSKCVAKEALMLTGIKRPKNVLLIPSAANNALAYNSYVRETGEVFGALGAKVKVLHGNPTSKTFKDPSAEQIANMVGEADVIWMCGGNTTQAREIFERTGIGKVLVNSKGKVIAGGSAGALELAGKETISLLTPEGHPDKNRWVVEHGIGIFKPILAVHNDFIENLPWRGGIIDKPRSFYHEKILKELLSQPNCPDFGVGIDDESAIAIRGDDFKVINADDAGPNVGVTTYQLHKNRLIESHFTPKTTQKYRPLKLLHPVA